MACHLRGFAAACPEPAHRLIAAAIILPVLLKKVFWLFLLRHRVGEGALGSQQGRLGRILTFIWSLF